MKKTVAILMASLFLFLGTVTALAMGYEWRDHVSPFDFLFYNHIDTHQQSQIVDHNKLEGFFYIRYNGVSNDDGYPVATHANCSEKPDECTVGWVLQGIFVKGMLLQNGEGQHPVWCIDPKDVPRQPGYTHFHWLGKSEHAGGLTIGETYEGYLLKLTAIDTFFFDHHGGFLVTPGIDIETHANITTDCETPAG